MTTKEDRAIPQWFFTAYVRSTMWLYRKTQTVPMQLVYPLDGKGNAAVQRHTDSHLE